MFTNEGMNKKDVGDSTCIQYGIVLTKIVNWDGRRDRRSVIWKQNLELFRSRGSDLNF